MYCSCGKIHKPLSEEKTYYMLDIENVVRYFNVNQVEKRKILQE